MSTYTKDKNIYFLNDKNIAQSLDVVATSKVNPIPSLDLVNNLCATTNQISSNLVRDLSSYANDLSDALCATVDNRRKEDKSELSNVLSTYANSLCAQISTEISADRVSDKIELSNVLSSYTDSKIISLSSSLSNQINNEFVHISGDSITGSLAIDNALKVKNETYLYGKTYIYGNIIHGKDTKALEIDRGIVFGVNAIVKNEDSFVWNGNNDTEDYSSHSQGTFNINPLEGSRGFYIGEQTLSDIIKDDVKISSDNLSAQISSASAMISAWVYSDRKNDKSELSNVLSNYANSLCTQISIELSTDRLLDKAELSDVLSTYVNQLCSSISSCIISAGYAIYNDYDFTYDTNSHYLSIVLKDQNGNPFGKAIDATNFIKNRIVDHMEIKSPGDPGYDYDPPVGKVLRLYWKNAEEKLEFTDIQLKDIAEIYKPGDGISITEDLSISVIDYNGIVYCLNKTSVDVATLSNDTIPKIDDRLSSVEKYVEKLSFPVYGTIDTLSIDLHNLSDNISAEVNALSSTVIKTISVDLDENEAHVARLRTYADQLSGASGWIGDIPYLSGNIDRLRTEIRGAANFCGRATMSKYNPDWIDKSETNTISTFFKYAVNNGTEKPIKNGNIYEVKFTIAEGFSIDDPIYAADQYYDFDDGIRIAHNDFIIVHSPVGAVDIPLSELNKDSVKIISDVRFFEHYQLSNTVFANTPWLSGGNRLDAKYYSGISANGYNPEYIISTGHAISGNNDIGGNNHFLDGNNIFDGYNCIEQLSTCSLSTEKLSGCEIVANGISAYQLSANNLSAYRSDIYDLSVGNNLSVDGKLLIEKDATFNSSVSISDLLEVYGCVLISSNLGVNNALTAIGSDNKVDIENLSARTISVDWHDVKNSSNGYSLFDLSTALSNKIWIDDQVDHAVNGTSDLSIVKIAKDKFDEMVADEHSIMSGNTIYVVDSDYIDAYGQVITNLAMDKDDPSYMLGIAASKPYVDFVSNDISTTVDQNRIADKKELSNVLSTYANSLCASISSTVDQNRIADKKELSNVLSTYTDTKIEKLSNILSSISYAIKYDSILSNGITNDSDISTILSATVKIFNLLSSF